MTGKDTGWERAAGMADWTVSMVLGPRHCSCAVPSMSWPSHCHPLVQGVWLCWSETACRRGLPSGPAVGVLPRDAQGPAPRTRWRGGCSPVSVSRAVGVVGAPCPDHRHAFARLRAGPLFSVSQDDEVIKTNACVKGLAVLLCTLGGPPCWIRSPQSSRSSTMTP